MKTIIRHITKCAVAGIVAILPIGGLIITVGYLEVVLSGSGFSKLPFYFPGLGLLAVSALIYLIGLIVTTFIGKWLWQKIDNLLDRLPALGRLYQTLKQILGYGEGKDAIFIDTVLVQVNHSGSREIGLVTNHVVMPDGAESLVVFLPGSPNPTTGRLLLVNPEDAVHVNTPVSEALKALVAVGKVNLTLTSG